MTKNPRKQNTACLSPGNCVISVTSFSSTAAVALHFAGVCVTSVNKVLSPIVPQPTP
jgi:hypothetical protein